MVCVLRKSTNMDPTVTKEIIVPIRRLHKADKH